MAETNGRTRRLGAGEYLYTVGECTYHLELVDGKWLISDIEANGFPGVPFDAAQTLAEAKALCDGFECIPIQTAKIGGIYRKLA